MWRAGALLAYHRFARPSGHADNTPSALRVRVLPGTAGAAALLSLQSLGEATLPLGCREETRFYLTSLL